MVGIGIDIGSTAAKAAVVETDNAVAWTCVMPTGYSSVDAAERLRGELAAAGYDVTGDDVRVVATGYGRCRRALCAQGRDRDHLPRHRCRAPVWRPWHGD